MKNNRKNYIYGLAAVFNISANLYFIGRYSYIGAAWVIAEADFTPETLAAYRDHGDPAARLEDGIEAARSLPLALRTLGIDLDEIARQLEEEGLRKFVEPYDKLLATLAANTI